MKTVAFKSGRTYHVEDNQVKFTAHYVEVTVPVSEAPEGCSPTLNDEVRSFEKEMLGGQRELELNLSSGVCPHITLTFPASDLEYVAESDTDVKAR